jgi:hypothetical protein
VLTRPVSGEHERKFFTRVLGQAQPYLSKEHFTVDGRLIEAWASQKSLRPKHGARRTARTSTASSAAMTHTNPRPTRRHACTVRATGSMPSSTTLGHVVVENRNGLIVDAMATQADGTAEADAALPMGAALRRKRPRGIAVTP